MNTTTLIEDSFEEAFAKNIVVVSLGLIINFINGMFVVTYFSCPMFSEDSRYILYIHLVINDMLMILVSVTLYVLAYASPLLNVSLCCILLVLGKVIFIVTQLNLAGMAMERFIAICKPLHHSQICTPQRTYIFICLLWVLGVIPYMADVIMLFLIQPISFFRSLVLCNSFNVFPTKAHQDNTTASQFTCMSLVCLTLIYTYCRVLFTARKAVSNGSANKAQRTILLHGVQLSLCTLSYINPFRIIIINAFSPQYRSKIAFSLYLLTHLIPRLLSPLIYGVRDQKFMKQMKVYFKCRVILVKIVPSKS